jgi:hypothetical protein
MLARQRALHLDRGGVAYAVAAGNDDADASNFFPARVAQALGAGSPNLLLYAREANAS